MEIPDIGKIVVGSGYLPPQVNMPEFLRILKKFFSAPAFRPASLLQRKTAAYARRMEIARYLSGKRNSVSLRRRASPVEAVLKKPSFPTRRTHRNPRLFLIPETYVRCGDVCTIPCGQRIRQEISEGGSRILCNNTTI